MKRAAIALFTLFSILFLIAVGALTTLLLADWEGETATPTATVRATAATPTTQPARATLTPARTPVAPQPARTPRPTTTPALTATPAGGTGAISAANAADVVERGTVALEGAPDTANAIRSFAWSPDGALIAAPEPGNNRVALIDAETRALARTIAAQDEPVRSVAFSPDGSRLATGSREITIWNVESGEMVATLEGHTQPALSLAFSPDGATLVSTGADGSVRLWDAGTGEPQSQVRLGVAGQAVAFSPDGATFAAYGERIVKVWEVESGEEIATLEHSALVSGMAFTPDGQQIATASLDGAVRVWDLETGDIAATLRAADADAQPLGLAYTLDGTALAVGDAARPTLDLIDAQTGEVLAELEAGALSTVVRFAADGRQLAALSGQRGEALTIWGLPE